MARAEFEKELESYISARKKKKRDIKGFLKKLIPKPAPKSVELPPEIQSYDLNETPAEPKKELEGVDTALEAEYEEEKKPVVQKILEWFRPRPKEVHLEDKEKEALEEKKIKEMVDKELVMQDLKEIAKIALFVIKQLPPEQLQEFKNSSDFADLKQILQKYRLIK